MEPLVAGHEGSDGRLSPPATQLDGTLRLSGVTDKHRADGGRQKQPKTTSSLQKDNKMWIQTLTNNLLWVGNVLQHNATHSCGDKHVSTTWHQQSISLLYMPILPQKKNISTIVAVHWELHSVNTIFICWKQSTLCEVFGSVPCSRAAHQQMLRNVENYSFTLLSLVFSQVKNLPVTLLQHQGGCFLQFCSFVSLLRAHHWGHLVKTDISAVSTQFLGLSMRVILQFTKEGVLLGQQHFDVLHAHSDDPGANIRLKSVDTLTGQRGDGVDDLQTDIINWNSLQCIYNELISGFGVNSAIWLPSYSSLFISFDDEYSSDSRKKLPRQWDWLLRKWKNMWGFDVLEI